MQTDTTLMQTAIDNLERQASGQLDRIIMQVKSVERSLSGLRSDLEHGGTGTGISGTRFDLGKCDELATMIGQRAAVLDSRNMLLHMLHEGQSSTGSAT